MFLTWHVINRYNNVSVSHGACQELSGKWVHGPRAVKLQGFLVLLPGSAVLGWVWLAQIPWPSLCLAVWTLYGCVDGVVVECRLLCLIYPHAC